MFNKKKDVPTIVGITIVVLLVIASILFLLSVPFFSFYGFVSILDRYHLNNLLTVDFFENNFINFLYIILVLGSIHALVMLLEFIFIVLKKREILNISSKHHKFISFVLLVSGSFLITKVVILNIFQRIHCSNLFLLIVFLAIYFILFVCSDTYRKQEASL
ncbi:hypothetical protein [Priestia endophytica]|uniref:hypothetical protein n=1 Tax=Priestia endophytica TaxID=135735 RepID=UPI000DCA8029|nr:hypothetical protein [Priestia endophytica]RAS77951.1 hypothetical protein A4U60_17775 [Priestia endophytica]